MGVTGFKLAEVPIVVQKSALIDWLVSLIPVNPFEALSTGNLLQTTFSAALIGVEIQLVGEKATKIVAFIESSYFIFEKALSLILYVAPLGIFALTGLKQKFSLNVTQTGFIRSKQVTI